MTYQNMLDNGIIKPVAGVGITNVASFVVFDNDNGDFANADSILCGLAILDSGYKSIRRRVVHYDMNDNDRAYLTYNNMRFYLNEIMRY